MIQNNLEVDNADIVLEKDINTLKDLITEYEIKFNTARSEMIVYEKTLELLYKQLNRLFKIQNTYEKNV